MSTEFPHFYILFSHFIVQINYFTEKCQQKLLKLLSLWLFLNFPTFPAALTTKKDFIRDQLIYTRTSFRFVEAVEIMKTLKPQGSNVRLRSAYKIVSRKIVECMNRKKKKAERK